MFTLHEHVPAGSTIVSPLTALVTAFWTCGCALVLLQLVAVIVAAATGDAMSSSSSASSGLVGLDFRDMHPALRGVTVAVRGAVLREHDNHIAVLVDSGRRHAAGRVRQGRD